METREMTKEEQAAHIEELRKEAEELGIEVKGNWGIPKLSKEIRKATEEVTEEEETTEEVPTVEIAEENVDKFLYQGKVIGTDELLAILEKKVTRRAAVNEVVRIKRAPHTYASAIIGMVTHINN